ncbi:carboxysome shell carbonic anhydrase, partial [Pseudomonadota bacterium]
LDMRAMYAWCVFETFRRFADEFYNSQPLAQPQDEAFQGFIESCGFHTLDFSPCADGRLAHIIRYVLRLPHKAVRRKSYAGAMFDVEDSLQKWLETEFTRQHNGKPNNANDATRYLKVAVYHYSSSKPDEEGCAAHGSDPIKAAEGALSRLVDFQQGVENSHCCGASIDLLLIGIDTDNDAIRIHQPDAQGYLDSNCYVDSREIYEQTRHMQGANGEAQISDLVWQLAKAQGVVPSEGMVKLTARLMLNNISQIDYVQRYFNGCYSDIGHQERFIGMGIGFEEVQLRNLTYFAYLKTVEQGAKDLDVGIKIFTGLNINRGLPAPVVIRYDYHGNVPGARERAVARCQCLDNAMRKRFADLASQGLLHTLLVVRDCNAGQGIEVIGSSIKTTPAKDVH